MPDNTIYNNRASSNIVYLFGSTNSGQTQEDDCCPIIVVEDREDLASISDPQELDVAFIQNGSNGGIDVAIFLGGQWIIKSLKGAKGDKGNKGDKGDKGERGEAGQNGLNGANGQTGLAPKHRWSGTKLQFELPDGSWGTLVDLRGQDGTNGTNGSNGAKGDKPNHEWNGTELRFELPNGTWGVPVNLRGERGEKGDFPAHEWSAANEIRFQNPDSSWGAWQNIRGEKGDDGQDGIDGIDGQDGIDGLAPEHEIGSDNRSIRFKNPDSSWGAWVVLTSDLIDNGVVYFDYLGLELPTSPVAGQMWYIPTYNKFYEYGEDWVVEASPVRNKIYYYTTTNTLYARDETTGSLIILAQVVTKTSQIENDGEFGVGKYLEVGEANITYQKLSEKGVENGYAPLDEFVKVASGFLNIVNDLTTGGSEYMLSAEQGKELKRQIDVITLILTSDDINLDTVQELVDAIKTVETSLETILVNDLTTGGTTKALTAEMGKLLQTNKVDKVAGERLINAAEITKLAGLGNVITTVKTIVSTALGTQNVAGFVTYINALNPVLVVGANETVTYKTSDTGRVFELLLRGRSFGVGQPAIVAADVIETTEFLNKDIRLSNYPSSRNDGQLPTNKVLAPDVNGNLKLFTIATAPAPYLDELIPGSYLPSNTENFILRGAFFTPNMTVQIVGQTVNYVTFVSDNLVKVNVTTGATDGSYAVTLNNGISATFNNALLIVLGTIIKPLTSEWVQVSGSPFVFTDDKIEISQFNLPAIAYWNKALDISINFRLDFNFSTSPLGFSFNGNQDKHVTLLNIIDNSVVCEITEYAGSNTDTNLNDRIYDGTTLYVNSFPNSGGTTVGGGIWSNFVTKTISFRCISGVVTVYFNNLPIRVLATTPISNLRLKFNLSQFNASNIKYILLS